MDESMRTEGQLHADRPFISPAPGASAIVISMA